LQGFLLRELSEVSRAPGPLFCEPLHRTERHLARMLGQTQSSEPRLRQAAEEISGLRNALQAGPGQSYHAPDRGLP
jgi:hypothetical protein